MKIQTGQPDHRAGSLWTGHPFPEGREIEPPQTWSDVKQLVPYRRAARDSKPQGWWQSVFQSPGELAGWVEAPLLVPICSAAKRPRTAATLGSHLEVVRLLGYGERHPVSRGAAGTELRMWSSFLCLVVALRAHGTTIPENSSKKGGSMGRWETNWRTVLH